MTPNIQIARKNIITPTQDMKHKKRPKGTTNTNKPSTKIDNKENDSSISPYDPNSMKYEIDAGINLLLRFVQNSSLNPNNEQSLQSFKEDLFKEIHSFYTGHWYPERPMKGSAYRCLRINQNGTDSLIEKTAKTCKVEWIVESLPKEFSIWIDPHEVSYRIGEEGSICAQLVRYT